VNCVSPRFVAAEGYDASGFTSSDFEKQGVAMKNLGRGGEPNDIAGPVAFLAPDDAHWGHGRDCLRVGRRGDLSRAPAQARRN
jgi:3-oxoacyl-[acyl-carrier protein] reductase